MIDNKKMPKNVGIIMDGNGRWANERGLQRQEGHTKGLENLISILEYIYDLGAQNVVCYSLSTENLNRSKEEVGHILELVLEYFEAFLIVCQKHKICVKFVGNLKLFPEKVQLSLKKTEELLSVNKESGRTLYMALAYGSRDEVITAVNNAVIKGEMVTEESFLSQLFLPIELDLVIRTGGEQRLSNFFLYQSSYAELYFSDKYFPDFNKEDLVEIFNWFASRNRKYGLVR